MSSPRQLGTRPIAAGALLAALALLLGLAAYYLPVVGALLGLVAPLPLAVANIRFGARLSVMTTAAASLLAALLSGPLAAMFVLSNCLVGLALGTGIRRQWPAGRTVVLAGATGFGTTLASIAVAIAVLGPGLLAEANAVLRASFAAATEAARVALGEAVAAEYAAIAELALSNIWLWLALSAAGGYLMLAWVWYGVGEPVLVRLGLKVPALSPIPPAERWHLRPVTGLVFLAGYFVLAVVAPHIEAGTAGALLFQVAATAVFTAFRIQGFGLLAHLFSRAGFRGGMRTITLIMLGILALTNQLLFMLLFYAGLADLALDLRGFGRRGNGPAQQGKGPRDGAKKE